MAVNAHTEFDIDVPPATVMDVLRDVESLPNWSGPHKSVEILESDADGNPCLVRIEVAMLGVSDQQTLRYFWTDTSCRWELVESKQLAAQRGHYEVAAAGSGSRVRFAIEVDLKIKLPGLLVKQGQKAAVQTAATGLTAEARRRTGVTG